MSYSLDTIRLLIAHDSQDQAEQLMNALRNVGKATRAELALNEDDLLRALKSGSWELILTRPKFGGCEYQTVMKHLQRLGKPVPVVVMVDQFDAGVLREVLEAGARAAAPADDRDLLMLLVDQQVDYLRQRKDLQQTELALHDAERRLSVLMSQSRDAIAYVVDGMHIHANETYLEMFGYPSSDELAGVPIMDMVSADDHEKLKKVLRSRAQDESQTQELECKGVTTEGKEFDAAFVFSPSTYDGEACTQIVIHAQTGMDESVLQEKLQEISQTDQVTGLYNRSWFMGELDKAVSGAVNNGQLSAVLYLRIDNFEKHQSAVGIEGGDELLCLIAKGIRQTIGEDAPLARVVGEDFAILLPANDPDDIRPMAEELRGGLEKLMPEVQSRTLQVTVSIGAAFAREDSRNSQSIITKALECCNKAQQANDGSGNAVHIHDPMDDVDAGSSEAVMMALKHGLENNGFRLLYQPIMNLEDESDHFYEVFVNLPQKEGDDLKPDAFMPVAGEYGMAAKVDRWVILNAIRKASTLAEPVRLLINLSGFSLQDPSLAEWIGKAIKASKFKGSNLVFQFSEGDAVNFLKQASVFAKQIAAHGCGISISRFAAGVNPFKLFEHLPATMVKFEGSYTQELDNKDRRAAFATLIDTAGERKCKVLVGFVESAAQMQTLWTLGNINYLQGYYLQPPSSEIQLAATADE